MTTELVDAATAAAALGVSAETLRRLFRSGAIPGYRLGRALRFDVEEVRAATRTGCADDEVSLARRSRVEPDFDAVDAA